jgi:hypothetical protein
MTPKSIDEAKRAGWKEMTKAQIDELRVRHPSLTSVDCNVSPNDTPCGSFGDSIVCFCRDGLCACFSRE